jgi:RNA-directed DNA polymerase
VWYFVDTFLGQRFVNIYRNDNIRVKIYPSKKNQKEIIASIGNKCRKLRSISTFKLIELIKPMILGWAHYFKYTECKEVFNKIDHKIFQIIRSWVFRRDRKNGRRKITKQYFPSGKIYKFRDRKYQDKWILFGKSKGPDNQILENWLPKISWIQSEKFIELKGSKSVYDNDKVYWNTRA